MRQQCVPFPQKLNVENVYAYRILMYFTFSWCLWYMSVILPYILILWYRRETMAWTNLVPQYMNNDQLSPRSSGSTFAMCWKVDRVGFPKLKMESSWVVTEILVVGRMNQSKTIPCKSKDYKNKNPPGFVNWIVLSKTIWSLQETEPWAERQPEVGSQQATCRLKCTAESFLKPEVHSHTSDRWHTRGVHFHHIHRVDQKHHHLPNHLDVVRLLLLWMQLTDLVWTLDGFLLENICRKTSTGRFFFEAEKELDQSTALRQERLHLCWRSRNRLRLVQICYKRCFGLSTSVQRSRRDMVGQWFTFETSIPGSSFLWLRGNCCFPDKVVHGDSM